MAVGRHLAIGDWDNKAFELFTLYKKFCALAKEMRDDLAPVTDEALMASTGYSAQDVVDLKTGVNVSYQLSLLSADVNGASVEESKQVKVFISKFGGA